MTWRVLEAAKETVDQLDPAAKRRSVTILAALAASLIALTALNGRADSLGKKARARHAAANELQPLKQGILLARARSEQLANLVAASKDDTLAKICDGIGPKGHPDQIRPMKLDGELQGEAAELRFESLSANETVNLLHRLEKSGKPVAVRKVHLKQRFDNQGKLDLAIEAVLVRSAGGAAPR